MIRRLGRDDKSKPARYLAGPAGGAAILIAALMLLGSGVQVRPTRHRAPPHAVNAILPAPTASAEPAPSAAAAPTATASAPPPAPSGPGAGLALPAPPVPPPPAVPIATSSTVAYLNGPPSIQIYSAPDPAKPMMTLKGHNSINQAEAFLVLSDATPGWYQVLLPVAPNGTTGWVRAGDVQTTTTGSFLLVSLSRFGLYHYEDGSLVASVPVAIGKPTTPTPTGLFYIWASQLVSSAPYSPGIFALNGFTSKPVPGFLGAILGVHGWTDPSVIGTRASNGCVRVGSVNMRPLIGSLLLGTPVEIVA